MRPTPVVLLAFSLGACATSSRDLPPVSVAADTLAAIAAMDALRAPATWVREPVTSSRGATAEAVTLFPDATYRRRVKRGAETLVTHGRWTIPAGTARVVLMEGDAGPETFVLDDSVTWRALTSGVDADAGAPVRWRRGVTDAIAAPAALTGAFVYLADAAIFTECGSGKQHPVAMEGAYRELERAYGASASAGGSPLVVRIRARIGQAPVGEGDGMRDAILVDSVVQAGAPDGCAALALRSTVDGATWAAVAIAGAAVADSGRSVPTLALRPDEYGIAGTDGCNRYTGRAALRGADLVLTGPLASTRMACVTPGVMERAAAFTALLAEGGWLRLAGDTLVLARGPRESARFVRRP